MPEGQTIEVLIVGAGPSGLMMAAQLGIHGIPFRIIDKKEKPAIYSGALIVHSRTVEIFNQLGIAEKFIQESIIANKLNIFFNGKNTVQMSLKDIGRGLTKFPNLYLIEQSKTEQLLIGFLTEQACTIERKTELKSFTRDEKGVTSVLKLPDGKEETLKTQYLVATDGSHSLVREQLKSPFAGKKHPVMLFIIDCKAELDVPSDEMCFSFSDYSTSGFFPLKNGRKRVDGLIPKEFENNPHITFDDIEKKFAERLRMKVKIYNPEWFSVARAQQGYALSYQENNCFLVGDAAHTFTPVGAQGMNTGLQDAYNLAWKLAFVIQKKAKMSLLETYSAERINIAKKLVRSTGRLYNLVSSRFFFTKTFRLHVLPYLMKWILPLIQNQKVFREFCFKAVSEIGVNYRKSSLSQNASLGNFPGKAPQPGDRLPCFVFNENGKERNIQEKIKGTGFTLFIFSGNSQQQEIILFAENHKNILSLEIIPFTSETKSIYKDFGIDDCGCFLIRPDMYIAYRSNIEEVDYFKAYLGQYFDLGISL